MALLSIRIFNTAIQLSASRQPPCLSHSTTLNGHRRCEPTTTCVQSGRRRVQPFAVNGNPAYLETAARLVPLLPSSRNTATFYPAPLGH